MIKKFKNFLRKNYINLTYKFLIESDSRLKEADKIFTHLTKEEKITLFKLASKINNGFALEIGSYLGASACFIGAGLRGESKLICIDTWQNEGMSEGLRDTYKEFLQNTKHFKEHIIPVRGFSYDVVDEIKRITPEIELLFIDGDHSYEVVSKDWQFYGPLVKSGGYVVFHDIGWAEGVKKVVEEDVKPRLSEWKSIPNLFWGVKK